MQQVYIPMEQCWETIEDTVLYFRGVITQLQVLMNLPEPPTDIYFSIEEVSEVDPSDRDIILRSL